MSEDVGRVGNAEQALVNDAPPGHPPSGFDPSRVMQEFYLSRYYEPKPGRPADNILAAIEYTIDRFFASDRMAHATPAEAVDIMASRILAIAKVAGVYVGITIKPPRDSDGSPAETCVRCGGGNPSWSAPSPLWNAVMRGGSINGAALYHDMVCVKCFMQIAEEKGFARGWRLMATEVSAELETVTPSGRAWDEQDWLWKDPGSVERPVGIAQPPTKEPTP